MDNRGTPLSLDALQKYASHICGRPLGEKWARCFRARHGDIHIRWTTSLEACRARNLNPTLVREFFEILRDLVVTHGIPPENIYNMNEKGIQLGIGKRIRALVDRDQRTLYHVEDGSRELVTIIETVCADGTVLRPCVIFQGACLNLSWGHDNPCNAR